MKNGLLLKYLKKKASLGSMENSWEYERMIVKVASKGTSKNPGTSRSAKKLRIVSFVRKNNKGKERKYDRYATRR